MSSVYNQFYVVRFPISCHLVIELYKTGQYRMVENMSDEYTEIPTIYGEVGRNVQAEQRTFPESPHSISCQYFQHTTVKESSIFQARADCRATRTCRILDLEDI